MLYVTVNNGVVEVKNAPELEANAVEISSEFAEQISRAETQAVLSDTLAQIGIAWP